MNLHIIRALINGEFISYNVEHLDFEMGQPINEVANRVFTNQLISQLKGEQELGHEATQFLRGIDEAYTGPETRSWMRASYKLVQYLGDFENPHLAPTIAKIKQAQTLHKQHHPILEKNPPEFLLEDYPYLLDSVQANGGSISHIPYEYQTAELCEAAVTQNPQALFSIPNANKTSKVCLIAVKGDGRMLRCVPEAERTYDLCLAAVQNNGLALEFVPEEHQMGPLLSAAITQTHEAFFFLSPEKHTPDLCAIALKLDGLVLQRLSLTNRTPKLCKLAVAQNGLALEFVPEDKRTDEICLLAVMQNGLALKFVPENKRTDEIYREAVIQNGDALGFIEKNLRSSDLCELAIEQDPFSLSLVPDDKRSYDLCLKAVTLNGMTIQLVPEEHQLPPLLLVAITNHPEALVFLSSEQQTPDLCAIALKLDGLVLQHISLSNLTLELCTLAVENDGFAFIFVPEEHQTPEIIESAYTNLMHQLNTLIDPKEIHACAESIIEYKESLFLDDDHPLFQLSIQKLIHSDPQALINPKNPYTLFDKLKNLEVEPVSLYLPKYLIESQLYGINRDFFIDQAKKLQAKAITFEYFSKIPPESLKQLFTALDERLSALSEEAQQQVLDSIKDRSELDIDGHKNNFLESDYLHRLLLAHGDPTEVVPPDMIQFTALINDILKKPATLTEGEVLTPQEEALIRLSTCIQHCAGGKKEGLALAYNEIIPLEERIVQDIEHPYIHSCIQECIQKFVSTDNPFMHTLCQTADTTISQLAHQSIYIKNLIGKKVGLVWTIAFDEHTHTLYDGLVEQTPMSAVQTFYHYFSPQLLIETIHNQIRHIAQTLEEKIASLKTAITELTDRLLFEDLTEAEKLTLEQQANDLDRTILRPLLKEQESLYTVAHITKSKDFTLDQARDLPFENRLSKKRGLLGHGLKQA